nr:hypothetical protein [Escherichia coli]
MELVMVVVEVVDMEQELALTLVVVDMEAVAAEGVAEDMVI